MDYWRVTGPDENHVFHVWDPTDRLGLLGWARIELDERGEAWFAVRAYREGVGIGSQLLAAACDWADRHEIDLQLTARPYLVEWYWDADFVKLSAPPHVKMAGGQVYMLRKSKHVTTCGECEHAIPHGRGSLACVMREGCESGQCESNVSEDDDACEMFRKVGQ